MSIGQDRIYGNTFSNTRDQYNPNPYFNQPPNQYDPRYPNNYPYDQYQPSDEQHFQPHLDHVGNFTPFYITITICAIIGFTIFIINIALGCCSRYSEYWNDRHTGNRWIISLWTTTPHKQPPLEYSSELQEISSGNQVVYHHPQEEIQSEAAEFLELRTKRESEI